jgi:HlyD family secretion protein
MKRRIIPFIIVLFVLAGLGGWYWYTTANAEDPNKLELSGTIEVVQVNIAAETAGKILEFKVDQGDSVKTGDALGLLDDTLMKAQAEQARAALALAHITGVPAQIALAKANADLADLNLKRATITSPIDGTILRRSFQAGEFVGQGSAVFVVADLTRAAMTVYVGEENLGKVKLNQTVDVKTDSTGDKVFTGKITRISDKAEFTPATIQTKEQRVNLVFAVTIELDNTDGDLKPGMPADATISIK